MKSLIIPARRWAALLLTLPMALFHPGSWAHDNEIDEGPTLTGQWGGRRTALEEAGVDLQVGFKLDALRNTRGGLSRGYSPTGLADFRMELDLDKLADIAETTVHVHVMQHSLGRVNADHVGSLGGVTNIETYRNGTKFYRLWIEREWASERSALRAGLFPLEDEFFTMESAGTFIHPTGGPQADYALTRGAAIYNHAGWGARYKRWSEDRSRYAMLAILDRPREDTNFIRNTRWEFPRVAGAHFMAEVGLTPLAGLDEKDRAERFDKTAAGWWAYTRKENHLVETDAQGQPLQTFHWGWYALKEKTLWAADTGTGALSGFLRVSGADGRSTPVRHALNTGLRLHGWMPQRPHDVTAFMLALHSMSSTWRQFQARAGEVAAASENMLEINHQMPLRSGVTLMPLAQWITHPGGLQRAATARIVGLRLILTL